MRLVIDAGKSFGDLLFLGFTARMRYEDGKKTDELENYSCRMASSTLGGQIDVTVPPIVAVENIAFAQKVLLEGATVDPYGKTAKESSFAEIVLRCNAENILDAAKGTRFEPVEEKKPEEEKPEGKTEEKKILGRK